MQSRRSIHVPALAIPVLVAALACFPSPANAAGCGSESPELVNGDFESPGVAAGAYEILDASQVPPWNTTDVANGVEIWGDGFLGVPAYQGTSFAEVNANSFGTLYQDVVTTPGATMTWTVHHRGRDGTDVMKVLIGDPGTADILSDDGWDAISADISDSETAWGTTTDTYLVPAGQTCTRIAFRAVSSGVGIPSYGNLVDALTFTMTAEPPPPVVLDSGARNIALPPTDMSSEPLPFGGAAGMIAIVGLWLLAAGASGLRRPARS